MFRSWIARGKAWSVSKFEPSFPWALGPGMAGANMGGKLLFAL
jgi:hypothetical protein